MSQSIKPLVDAVDHRIAHVHVSMVLDVNQSEPIPKALKVPEKPGQ